MNRHAAIKIAVCAAFACVTPAAESSEYIWANLVGTGDPGWADTANWINADGTPATSYPKGADDTAVLRGCVNGNI